MDGNLLISGFTVGHFVYISRLAIYTVRRPNERLKDRLLLRDLLLLRACLHVRLATCYVRYRDWIRSLISASLMYAIGQGTHFDWRGKKQ